MQQIYIKNAQSRTDITEFLKFLVSYFGLNLYKNKQKLANLIADLYKGEERVKRLYRKAIIEDNLSLHVFELIDKTIEERKAILDAIAYRFAENNFYSCEIGQKVLYALAKGLSLQLSPLVQKEDNTWVDEFGGIYSEDKKELLEVPIIEVYSILKGTTAIGNCAFNVPKNENEMDLFFDYGENYSLISVYIPDSVQSIGCGTFHSCISLTDIVIPDSVTGIGEQAFDRCLSLTDIIIPNSVTSIGDRAFSGCSSLTSIVIPNGVTSIGDGAFSGCSSLTDIIIPDNVVNIGDSAFGWCCKLSKIKVASRNDHYKAIENVLYTIDLKNLLRCSSDKKIFIIPNDVTSIGNTAFSECSSLTNIIIPDTVVSIGDSAFSGCSSLMDIIISDSVESIGYDAFSGCSSLTSIIIPNSVKYIGWNAFYQCGSLKVIKTSRNVFNKFRDKFPKDAQLQEI